MTDSRLRLHKIFYDDTSRRQIAPPFIPLDNTDGPPGWFELYPILRYLETHELEADTWYGFLSPKFPEKANITLDEVVGLIEAHPQAQVALFSNTWLELVFFRNVWVQGESFHPGLIACAEAFLAQQGRPTDLRAEIGDFQTSVFGNYIIAKPQFWRDWQRLARAYYDYVETSPVLLADDVPAAHEGPSAYRLKTFVQERLPCWLLARGGYAVIHPAYTQQRIGMLPPDDSARLMRALLRASDALKRAARRGRVPGAFAGYRGTIWLARKTYALNLMRAAVRQGRPRNAP